jgi:hypothetical protein
MAESPPVKSPEDHKDERGTGPMCNCVVRLTDSALRYAKRRRLESNLERLALGPECAAGDLVSLEMADRPHDFVILTRRWVVSSEGRHLELTLDHPVRQGRSQNTI